METLSTKVPPWMMEKVEEYAEEIGESRSTATRELVQKGIEGNQKRATVPAWYIAALLGWVFVAGAFMEVGTTLGLAGGVLVILSALEGRLSLLDRLT